MNGPEPTMVTTVGVMIAYLAALLVIGWRAARRTHGGEDFHLAGRSLGPWAAGISSTASSESGWVTLGAVGMTYGSGISGLWFAPGCLLGYLVNLYFVAPRLRKLSEEKGAVTLSDVITRRWGDPRNVVRVVSVAIVLVCMMGYVAAQMTAAGKAFSAALGFDADDTLGYLLGVAIGALVIIAVTTLGGFRAVAWTDLFQGLLMLVALIGMPLYAVARLGGFGKLFAGLAEIDPNLLTATGGAVGPALFGMIVGGLGIGLGYPGMPHVITRYMATRSQDDIKRLRLIAILWGTAVFYGAGLLGLAGRVLRPGLADGEKTLIVLSGDLLHPVLAGLILAAVFSAILSTVSSQLLVAASAVSYDLVEKVFGYGQDDRRRLLLGRCTVAIVGLLGILVATTEVRVVFWFVLFAWSGLGASFGPLILFAMTPIKVNRYGALAAMLTGSGVTLAWRLGRDRADDPVSFAAMFLVTLVIAAGLILFDGFTRRMEAGEKLAALFAATTILASWGLVQVWGLQNLYELVPAFAFATAATLVVSRLVQPPDDKVDSARA